MSELMRKVVVKEGVESLTVYFFFTYTVYHDFAPDIVVWSFCFYYSYIFSFPGYVIASSKLSADAVEVRRQTVNWQSYVQ